MKLKVFAGNSNIALAQGIARNLGIPLSKAEAKKFSNQETRYVAHIGALHLMVENTQMMK